MEEESVAAEEVTLLIDGDVLAFRAAASAQHIEEDGFGYVRPFASVIEGQAIMENLILHLTQDLKATHVRIVLSDPDCNWRSGVLPTYKGARDYGGVTRPLLLGRNKQFLRDAYSAVHWASLEADDVLGIMATEPPRYAGKRIVVGRDKDFKSIPGLHYQLGDLSPLGHPVVRSISQGSADRWHMVQALAGDRVDDYGGCPGIGMTRAERIIDAPVLLTPRRGIITRGKNKGQETTKWMSQPTHSVWACIVSHYAKEGLDEAYALKMARVARILRHEDYDQETATIKLWTPPGPGERTMMPIEAVHYDLSPPTAG